METANCEVVAHSSPRVETLLSEYKDEIATEAKSSRQRKNLMTSALEEAERAYKAMEYEVALQKFVKVLAALELDAKVDKVQRASAVANIGTTLHCLSYLDEAQGYYVQALELFEATPTWTVTWLFYGNINQKRISFLKARLGDISLEKPVDPTQYLDGNGVERHWSTREMATARLGPVTYFSYVNPYSWWQWYNYKPLTPHQPVAANTVA